MKELFIHGRSRMADLLQRVKDPVSRAQMEEALECMTEAFWGECDKAEDINKQLERLQRRYDKLKEDTK